MNVTEIQEKLLELADAHDGDFVNIAPFIFENSNHLQFAEQVKFRLDVEKAIGQLKRAIEITHTPLHLTGHSGEQFLGTSGTICNTYERREKLKEKKIVPPPTVVNTIEKNYGIANQGSDLYNSHINQSATNSPATKERQQNAIVKFILKFWWAFILPLIVAIVALAIEYKWFAK